MGGGRARRATGSSSSGPGGAYAPDPAAPWHLLVGDPSVLPAIAASLERIPAGVPAFVVVEVDGPEDELPLETPGALDLRWVRREDGALLGAVRALELPGGAGQCFVHGEATAVREVRKHLLLERGVEPERLSVSGYWKRRRTDEEWRADKAEWLRQAELDTAGARRPHSPRAAAPASPRGGVQATSAVQNVHAMRPEVREEYAAVAARLGGRRGVHDAAGALLHRAARPARRPVRRGPAVRGRSSRRCSTRWRRRRASAAPDLRRLDHEREITPDWLHREQAVGYVCYADRFGGTLQGVRERLPYLRELGVTYLHLMPLLAARPEPNDGGYAVADYGRVEPALGTMDDLRALAADLRAHGMALCVDVVLNHTAREHAWAQAALAGDAGKLAYYRTFPDRGEPDEYERTLPEVFPDIAPGNFSWVPELGRWVWTTFNEYQWDLDYTNPEVFRAMAEVVLGLAAAGIDVLRLDAVPFLWKRKGTDCQNQPEVHQLLQALRAVARIATPAVAFKAEAIVAPEQLVTYLGTGRHEGKECDLAYNNVLMALLWSSLASGRVALMTHVLGGMPAVPPGAGWVTYVRCHDDIGWAIGPEDAAAVGEDAHLHRRFLADFYAGEFPGTFARGARFQADAATGEARTSGTAASLAGLEAALELGDPVALELAVRRLLVLHAVAFAHGGLPLIYMGDELGLLNDRAWRDDAHHAGDNRWMHRPPMDWAAAERRREAGTAEAALWDGLRRLIAARRGTRAAHAQGSGGPLWTGNDHVYGVAAQPRRRAAAPARELQRRRAARARRARGAARARARRRGGRGAGRPPAADRGGRARARALPVPLDRGLTPVGVRSRGGRRSPASASPGRGGSRPSGRRAPAARRSPRS